MDFDSSNGADPFAQLRTISALQRTVDGFRVREASGEVIPVTEEIAYATQKVELYAVLVADPGTGVTQQVLDEARTVLDSLLDACLEELTAPSDHP